MHAQQQGNVQVHVYIYTVQCHMRMMHVLMALQVQMRCMKYMSCVLSSLSVCVWRCSGCIFTVIHSIASQQNFLVKLKVHTPPFPKMLRVLINFLPVTADNQYLRVHSGALEKVAALPGGAEAVSSVTASSENKSAASQQAFPVRLV